jgi:hypothetical protein
MTDETENSSGAEMAFDFDNPTEALSLDKAAQILGDSLKDDAPKGREREPNGQFAKRERQADDENKVVSLRPGQTDKAALDQKTEDPAPDAAKAEAEDEDPEFEFEPEAEGKEPVRRKLSELVEAYEKASTLEKEIETLRSQAGQVPEEYTTGLQETLQARATYIKGLEFVSKLFNPQPPNVAMLDQNSASYDPDGYRSAYQAYEQAKAAVERIRSEHEQLVKDQEAEQSALMKAHLAKEAAALHKAWPEIRSPEVAKQVAETLKRDYGFTDQEIAATSDHRMFLVIRDAMAFRASKAKEAEAVKVVRKLPKLVKGAARSTTDSKAAGRSQAMARLAESGSIHDAVKAIEGLI